MAGKNQTFDPQNIESIRKLANEARKWNSNEVDDDFVLRNIRIAINELKKVKKEDFEKEHTNQLLRLMANISAYCQSTIVNEIIKEGLHPIFKEIIVDQFKKKKINYKIVDFVYMTLSNLTDASLKMAKQNEENGFYKLTTDLLDRLGSDAVNTINNDDSFGLYDGLICFILNNAEYKEMKDSLIKSGFVDCLSNEFNKFNNLKASKNQIKYIMLAITQTLSYLLNDKELDTLPLSNDIVDHFIMALNECIESEKSNTQVLRNTKYYIQYSIGGSKSYDYASGYLDCVRIIAINDTIQQKLFDKGIMTIIEEILLKGNQDELCKCTQLLCTLCFNQNVIGYLNKKKDLKNIIKNIKESTTKDTTKDACVQIEKMLSENEPKKRAPTAQQPNKSTGHIMISYNHKYKTECSKINDELKKRGYKTWMDVNSSFNDLYDAMADAIENASIVLICYSFEYKTSNNCRFEALRAVKLNKNIIAVKVEDGYNPDGWLGLILSGYLYVNFSKDMNSPVTFNNLFKQIDSFLNQSNENTQQTKPYSPAATISNKPVENPIDWNKTDVQNWLKENDLDSLAVVFQKLNGLALSSLYEMKQNDYSGFINFVDKEIDKSKMEIDAVEKLSFYKLIDKLFGNN